MKLGGGDYFTAINYEIMVGLRKENYLLKSDLCHFANNKIRENRFNS